MFFQIGVILSLLVANRSSLPHHTTQPSLLLSSPPKNHSTQLTSSFPYPHAKDSMHLPQVSLVFPPSTHQIRSHFQRMQIVPCFQSHRAVKETKSSGGVMLFSQTLPHSRAEFCSVSRHFERFKFLLTDSLPECSGHFQLYSLVVSSQVCGAPLLA